jgi:hypothetical protein
VRSFPWHSVISRGNSSTVAREQGQLGWSRTTRRGRFRTCDKLVLAGQIIGAAAGAPAALPYDQSFASPKPVPAAQTVQMPMQSVRREVFDIRIVLRRWLRPVPLSDLPRTARFPSSFGQQPIAL